MRPRTGGGCLGHAQLQTTNLFFVVRDQAGLRLELIRDLGVELNHGLPFLLQLR
jgi:hypothetical protein